MIEEVMIRMGVDARPVSAALRGVRKSFADFKADMKGINPMDALRTTAGKLGIGLSIAGFAAAAKASIEYAHEIHNLSDELSVSASTLQAWSMLVSKTGGDSEAARKALEKFAVKVGEARNGNKDAVEWFKALGLALTDQEGKAKGVEQMFADFADRVRDAKEPIAQITLASEAFGEKLAGKVVNSLKDGAKGLEDFKKAASSKILSDADVERLDRLFSLTKGFAAQAKAVAGKSVSMLSAFFLGDAGTDEMISRLRREMAQGSGKPLDAEGRAARAKAAAEALVKLEKARRDLEMDGLPARMRLARMNQEQAEIKAKMNGLDKQSAEYIDLDTEAVQKEKEIRDEMAKIAKQEDDFAKDKLKKQEDLNKSKEHEREVLKGIADAEQRRADAVKSLADSQGDRSRFSLQDLAGMDIIRRHGYGYDYANNTDAMAGQIMAARQVLFLENRAKALAAFGDEAGSQAMFSRADKLRSGISALTSGEREPFQQAQKAAVESAEALKELIAKAKADGIPVAFNMNP